MICGRRGGRYRAGFRQMDGRKARVGGGVVRRLPASDVGNRRPALHTGFVPSGKGGLCRLRRSARNGTWATATGPAFGASLRHRQPIASRHAGRMYDDGHARSSMTFCFSNTAADRAAPRQSKIRVAAAPVAMRAARMRLPRARARFRAALWRTAGALCARARAIAGACARAADALACTVPLRIARARRLGPRAAGTRRLVRSRLVSPAAACRGAPVYRRRLCGAGSLSVRDGGGRTAVR